MSKIARKAILKDSLVVAESIAVIMISTTPSNERIESMVVDLNTKGVGISSLTSLVIVELDLNK